MSVKVLTVVCEALCHLQDTLILVRVVSLSITHGLPAREVRLTCCGQRVDKGAV